MKGLIEYLIIFIVAVILCPSNKVTLVYILTSSIFMALYFFIYLKNRKKHIKEEKYKFNLNIVIWLIMIVSINMINKIDITNLFFAYTTLTIFIIYTFAYLFKKDKITESKFLNYEYLFDFYTIIYLASLLISIMSHEI